ncbi:hypothetical protein CC85DRAFT_331268 [Cutaneotrichosporon oleaginosum]|uniref:Uncharacterized protein n=1 Tax=Cutaneotrichosporon oleaginosum TaxID=879819 RepID=A0A0J0XCN6_9TREE|nr:uncharacterized protein CC85DRAFT_331268 [Cutaneotrichosporon oleaginosum]KLT38822.1 hypothetical protein CC85DRAFT_331268 [Cutaneotrichosporon oleaginosum]TXT04733.1 hypothetical protein COLE_07552 [Cutaneotrichosporon oleaginosum]
MAPAATTSAAADPYACASYPSLDGATSAPPAYWPADRNATAGQRACTAFPNYYMVQCCGSASAGAGSASAVVREPKCGWEVCISSTTDAQWEACFKALDAQRGNVSDKGYTYKCASGEKKKEEEKMSGARRAVVGAAVVVAACMALAL